MSTLTLAAPIVNSGPAANPRDSWPAWTDESRWELGPEPDLGPPGDETGPTAGPDFEPTPEEMAYWSGFTLRLEGLPPADPPAGLDAIRRADFIIGQAHGLIARFRREDEDREHQLRLDRRAEERMAEAFGEPGEGWPESERIEARGVLACRRGA